MKETLLALFTAHLIADFVFQTNWMIANKKKLGVLALHGAQVGVAAYFTLGNFSPFILGAIVGTHLLMDAIKVYLLKNTVTAFLIDQAVHSLVILACAFLAPALVAQGWWPQLIPQHTNWLFAGMVLASGLILSVRTGGLLIGMLTAPLLTEEGARAGLPNGGKYIGWLERAFIMLLVLADQIAGVGFLVTAKSILRFGDIKESDHRKMTEYIIIGTFLSFGWGLLVALLTRNALRLWSL